MELLPDYEYSARIYAEVLSAIGVRMVRVMGPRAALGVFSQAARPVGLRDAKKLGMLLGAGRGGAPSAALIAHTAAEVLGLDSKLLRYEPDVSSVLINTCIYGDAVLRHKKPLVCAMCAEYNKGLAAFAGARFRESEKKISTGYGSCVSTFESEKAPLRLPGRFRASAAAWMVSRFGSRNKLLVSTVSSLLIGLGERSSRILGANAALIPARGAFDAGNYQGPIFSKTLGLKGGLEDSAALISATRKAVGCKVRTELSAGGFSIITRKCPQYEACSPGNFIETACVSYSTGLLSHTGTFGITSDPKRGICRQDFRLRMHAQAPAVRAKMGSKPKGLRGIGGRQRPGHRANIGRNGKLKNKKVEKGKRKAYRIQRSA